MQVTNPFECTMDYVVCDDKLNVRNVITFVLNNDEVHVKMQVAFGERNKEGA